MTYIPKNKVKSNLYTSGITEPGTTLLSTVSGELYTGYYHVLYNGKIFSGKTPNSLNKQELFIRNTDGDTDFPKITLTPYSPLLPTPQDYKNGEFIRYFICRRNQPMFIEISKDSFNKYKQKDPTISWKLYKPFSLFWVLTGDINQVAQTNKKVTELIETQENVLGLSLYLKEDWIQYYKENP
jgi:hypothetical protein